MSTRANIAICLKEGLGKEYKFDPSKLPEPYSDTFAQANEVKVMEKLSIPMTLEHEYLVGYCHYDGKPHLLGKRLLQFDTEEKAINLVMGGPISSLTKTMVEYIGFRPYKDIANKPGSFTPKCADDFEALDRDYTYLFDRGHWYFCENYNFVKEAHGFTEHSEWVKLDIWMKNRESK